MLEPDVSHQKDGTLLLVLEPEVVISDPVLHDVTDEAFCGSGHISRQERKSPQDEIRIRKVADAVQVGVQTFAVFVASRTAVVVCASQETAVVDHFVVVVRPRQDLHQGRIDQAGADFSVDPVEDLLLQLESHRAERLHPASGVRLSRVEIVRGAGHVFQSGDETFVLVRRLLVELFQRARRRLQALRDVTDVQDVAAVLRDAGRPEHLGLVLLLPRNLGTLYLRRVAVVEDVRQREDSRKHALSRQRLGQVLPVRSVHGGTTRRELVRAGDVRWNRHKDVLPRHVGGEGRRSPVRVWRRVLRRDENHARLFRPRRIFEARANGSERETVGVLQTLVELQVSVESRRLRVALPADVADPKLIVVAEAFVRSRSAQSTSQVFGDLPSVVRRKGSDRRSGIVVARARVPAPTYRARHQKDFRLLRQHVVDGQARVRGSPRPLAQAAAPLTQRRLRPPPVYLADGRQGAGPCRVCLQAFHPLYELFVELDVRLVRPRLSPVTTRQLPVVVPTGSVENVILEVLSPVVRCLAVGIQAGSHLQRQLQNQSAFGRARRRRLFPHAQAILHETVLGTGQMVHDMFQVGRAAVAAGVKVFGQVDELGIVIRRFGDGSESPSSPPQPPFLLVLFCRRRRSRGLVRLPRHAFLKQFFGDGTDSDALSLHRRLSVRFVRRPVD